ncbi:hypothetical protein BZA70DRAFT_275197 [Myxozyma melibiosi]|uniref:Uncharacterized protein n=1 Tax=Myxozyma melibiosi TaxID=54550 RepID=A0ABR1FAI3_9ASCO
MYSYTLHYISLGYSFVTGGVILCSGRALFSSFFSLLFLQMVLGFVETDGYFYSHKWKLLIGFQYEWKTSKLRSHSGAHQA